MKKILYIFCLIFVLSACSEDTTEYLQQKEDVEKANQQKQQEIDEQKRLLEEKEKEAEKLKQKLDSLERVLNQSGIIPEPQLLSMEFRKADNPELSDNVICDVYSSTGIVNCWLPTLEDSKTLVPRFTFEGTLMMMGSTEVNSGVTSIDFSNPVTLTVTTSKGTKDYVVYVYSYTGLPVMRIDTENGQFINSKTTYVNAHMKLIEDVKTRGSGDVLEADLRIKGRGNSTWYEFPKKPYRLKFNEKVSLLGEHKDKSWVLLPNYTDKSALRIHTAFYMGKISNLDYTSSSHFVDLFLNGRFDGTYELCEKLKIANHRVAVGDDGFLLEVDARAPSETDSRYFTIWSLENPISIKEPDTQYDDANFKYIEDYLVSVDNALYGYYFKDPQKGWQAYMDMDSFVDWYLINEITHNPDARMLYSCFMSLKRGEKLKMGPIWDFDLAFGNTDYWNRGPEGFWIKNSDWFNRLMEDPAYVKRVKERFDYFYGRLPDILNEIDEAAQYLNRSMIANENRWHTFYEYSAPNVEIWGSYQNEVQSIKEWLKARMEWLKSEYDKM